MTTGILWRNNQPCLLVDGGINREYYVFNGDYNLYLNLETPLKFHCFSDIGEKIYLTFDRFTYIAECLENRYQSLDDYNRILNDAKQLGIDEHHDIILENIDSVMSDNISDEDQV